MEKELETTKGIYETILENQDIIIKQNLFVLEFLMGDKAKQKLLKERLGVIFESSDNG
ncbi:MAG: hypothetical protein IKZ88_02910 [Neisseriaceae bacterium]|nr:hypothetical protein [Neisseriaceae bacterium]